MAFFSNDSIEITEEDASEWMKHLKKDVSDLEDLRPVYPLDVSFDFARMKEGFEQISNALHLKSPICDPSDYFLTTGVKGTKCWNIEIDGNSETAFNRAKANLLHVRIEGITVMEDCSLQSLISSGKAILVSPTKVVYPMKFIKNSEVTISVLVLGRHLPSSPQIFMKQIAMSENSDVLEMFSRELNNHYEKQVCCTYYI